MISFLVLAVKDMEEIKLMGLIQDNKYRSTNQILTRITPCWGLNILSTSIHQCMVKNP